MFRHKGTTRTLKHNLGIASFLSFVAGLVNVAGFLSIQRLTTNVTGHFAYFIDEIFKQELWQSLVYFLYIFFFFLGSFISNLLIEIISRRNENYVYVIPALIESAFLFVCAYWGNKMLLNSPDILAFSLLFAMGWQNSFVTTISNSAVRTTHLTGLFTDLGIELSQLFFYKQVDEKHKLRSSIRLRLTIISFFFIGGILGAFSYSAMGLYVLAIGGITLIAGVIIDSIQQKLMLKKVEPGAGS